MSYLTIPNITIYEGENVPVTYEFPAELGLTQTSQVLSHSIVGMDSDVTILGTSLTLLSSKPVIYFYFNAKPGAHLIRVTFEVAPLFSLGTGINEKVINYFSINVSGV